MSRSREALEKPERRTRLITRHLMLFGLIVIFHLIIFRGIVTKIPEIWKGNSIIAREELIPFFNFDSQYVDQLTSSQNETLTFSDEVRVSYSFGISWVRFYKFLPFALVLLNSVSCYLFFLALYVLLRNYTSNKKHVMAFSMLAIMPIYFILLYSKVTHFYALIIGFSLFTLALSLTIEYLFFRQDSRILSLLTIALLVLINPAVHFHVLYYLVLGLLAVVKFLTSIIFKDFHFKRFLRREVFATLFIIIFSLVPYAIYLKLTAFKSTGEISNQIPVNYWMIYYASLPMLSLFSLDTTAHIDLYKHGTYLVATPRIFTSFLFIFALAPFVIFSARKKYNKQFFVYLLLLGIVIASIWASLGYGRIGIITFHNLIGALVGFFHNSGDAFSNIVVGAIGSVVQVLRFPHRFQFVQFYALACMLGISLLLIKTYIAKRINQSPIVWLLLITSMVMPILVNADYRSVVISGNFDNFLKPYPIPQDLKNIKSYLSKGEDNKLFILPSMEGGRDIEFEKQRYGFIDKLFIYYLDTPTYYYGTGGDTANKLNAYMVYRSIAYNQEWWESVMANNIQATHILFPKKLSLRPNTEPYVEELESKVEAALNTTTKYKLVVSGDNYNLYERTEVSEGGYTFADLSWEKLLQSLAQGEFNSEKFFFNINLAEKLKSKEITKLRTDSIERTFYNIYLSSSSRNTSRPNIRQVPYSTSIVDSTLYTNTFLSMFTLLSKTNSYNYFEKNLPNYVGLNDPYFIGITGDKGKIKNKLLIDRSDEYRLLVKAAKDTNEFRANIDGNKVEFKRIYNTPVLPYNEFDYYSLDIYLETGSHEIEFSYENDPLALETIGVIPVKDIPVFTDKNIQIANFGISLSKVDEGIYEVRF